MSLSRIATRAFLVTTLVFLASRPASALPRVATTVGFEFPHIVVGQIDLIYSPKWTLGFNLGGFAYTYNSTSVGPVPLSLFAGNVHGRWAPFNGSFFLGLNLGLQKVGASATKTFNVTSNGQTIPVPAAAALNVTSPYIAPMFGWFFVTRFGFTFAFEFGAQIPMHSSSDVNVEITDPAQNVYLQLLQQTQVYTDTKASIEDQIGKYANIVLPYVAIRLGWTF